MISFAIFIRAFFLSFLQIFPEKKMEQKNREVSRSTSAVSDLHVFFTTLGMGK